MHNGYGAQRDAALRILTAPGDGDRSFTARDLAAGLGVSTTRASDIARDLVGMGLATRAGRPYRYSFGCAVTDSHGAPLRIWSSKLEGLWFVSEDSAGESVPVCLLDREAVTQVVTSLAGWLWATGTDQGYALRRPWSP